MRYPDTSHLSPEDAELVRVLYAERNRVGRDELRAVQAAQAAALNLAVDESTRATRRTLPHSPSVPAYVPQLAQRHRPRSTTA